MTYSVHAFRPQIYSYQSRSRFRQYPRDVRTSIPGAGFAVENLRWGEQAIDLSGLGTAPMAPDSPRKWWESTPAFWAKASPLGWDDYPQRSQAEAAGSPVFLRAVHRANGDVDSVVARWRTRDGMERSDTVLVASDRMAATTRAVNAVEALRLPTLSTAEVSAVLGPSRNSDSHAAQRTFAPESTGSNKLPLYIGLGLSAAALLGGGYYLMKKRGKRAA